MAVDRTFGSGGMSLFLVFILLYMSQKGSMQGYQLSYNDEPMMNEEPAAEKKYAVGMSNGEVMEQDYASACEEPVPEVEVSIDTEEMGEIVQPEIEEPVEETQYEEKAEDTYSQFLPEEDVLEQEEPWDSSMASEASEEPVLGGQNNLFLYPTVKLLGSEKKSKTGPKVSIQYGK